MNPVIELINKFNSRYESPINTVVRKKLVSIKIKYNTKKILEVELYKRGKSKNKMICRKKK